MSRLGIIKANGGKYAAVGICIRPGNPQRSSLTEIKDRVVKLDGLLNAAGGRAFMQCRLQRHDWSVELTKGAQVRAARKRNGVGRPPKNKPAKGLLKLSAAAIKNILSRDE